ncbi:MAG TPA: hypothetical protein VMZ50_05920 [Phycisphaerae bacterium]|nr:hypothetical protein [Phycisphaerae bacterium]
MDLARRAAQNAAVLTEAAKATGEMMIPRDEILRNHERLARAWGERIPALSESVRAAAGRAVDGVVSFYGTKHTRVGRSGIDWA